MSDKTREGIEEELHMEASKALVMTAAKSSETGYPARPEEEEPEMQTEHKEAMESMGVQSLIEGFKSEITRIQMLLEDYENELAKGEAIKQSRMDKMKDLGLYDAIIWLRENQHLFKGVIHEPMCLLIQMKRDDLAIYLENAVPHRDLTAFICENPKDVTVLEEEMYDKRKWKVNIICCPTASSAPLTHPHNLDDLREFGFHCYISDTFTAPDAVKRFLCSHYSLHEIPIGDETTFLNADKVPSHIGVFMTNELRFTSKFSDYTGELISTSSSLNPSELLTKSVDEEHIKQMLLCKKSKSEELAKLQEKLASLEAERKKSEHKLQ